MQGILLENQIGLFDGLFVLLHFVLLDDIFKNVRLFFGQGTSRTRLRMLRCGFGTHDGACGCTLTEERGIL